MNDVKRKTRVIALASGKGGVGKTSIAVNLSVALARADKGTLLIDVDYGLANAAIMLGVNPAFTLTDVVDGRHPFEDVMQRTEDGLLLMPGSSGELPVGTITGTDRRRIYEALQSRIDELDFVVIDTPSGMRNETMRFLTRSDRVLVVLTGEPTSFMDAYATVKLLALEHGFTSVSVIANMVDSEISGRDLFDRFHDVAARFLPSELEYLGSLPRDEHMRMAIMRKQPCVTLFPESRAAAGLRRLAHTLADQAIPPTSGGNLFFGMEHPDAPA